MSTRSRHLLTAVAAVSAFATGFTAAVVLARSGHDTAPSTAAAGPLAEPVAATDVPAWPDDFVHLVVTTATDTDTGGTTAARAAAASAVADTTTAAIADELRSVEGVETIDVTAPGLIAVAVGSERDRTAVAAVPGVTGVIDDVPLGVTDDPGQYQQWALANSGSPDQAVGWPGTVDADIDAVEAWSVTRGAGAIVAVIDSGFDLSHPDLAANLWHNAGEICGNGIDDEHDGFVDDCTGWDFGESDANASVLDPSVGTSLRSHGTHVAGIVAAARNGVGVVGVAPEATLMLLKVTTAYGGIGATAVLGAMRYAIAHGATAINLSIATGPNASRSGVAPLETGVAEAHAAGVFVAAGAGNNNYDVSTGPVYPAGFSQFYDNVMSVGATTNADTRASFSNYGSTVDISAPGWFISSTVPGGYNWLSGTSMATPMVAGAAALVRASGRAAEPGAIRTLLEETADQTAAGRRLNAAAAVGAVTDDSEAAVTFTGLDTLRADAPGAFSVWVTATTPATAPEIRISAASIETGSVVAVEGIAATVEPGPGSTTSDDRGLLATVPMTAEGLATGTTIQVTTALPAGSYAFVIEIGDASWGAPVFYAATAEVGSGAEATTLPPTTVVATPVTDPPATVPATTSPVGTTPGTTAPPTTTAATTAPPATAPATTIPATTAPGAPPTSTPTPATTPGTTPATSPATTPTTVPGQTATTAPPATAPSPPVTTTPSAATTTTGPPTTAAPTTAAPTTSTAPRSSSTTSQPASTSPPAATTTTTPAPPPDRDGAYRLASLSPRQASTEGGSSIVLTGTFPTDQDVYVWFGDQVVPARSGDGHTIVVVTAAHPVAGVVDVSVRFTRDRAYAMTMAGAFTFVSPPATSVPATTPPTTTRPGAPATTAPASTTPATTRTTTPSTAPATTRPPASAPPSTGTTPTPTTSPAPAPATTVAPSPVTTTPASTTPASTTPWTAPAPTVPPVWGHRGSATLRQPSTLAVAMVPATLFAEPCRQQTCAAGKLG